MCKSAEKKRLYTIVVSILVITICGTFAFSMTEIPDISGLAGNKPYSNGIFSPVGHTVDWLAEDTPTVGRANKTSSSAMRNWLTPDQIHNTAEYIFAFSVHTAKSDYFYNNKNTIQLKLRI
jgi:hypothetical protein